MRTISVYGSDFWDFYNSQTKKVQDKIDWVIDLVRTLQMIPERFFKHIEETDGLFEIRIKVGSNIFRLFCFFDEGNLVILLNGLKKKSQKTPKKEIEKAERLKQQYYDEHKK
ncbi:MAG: type II toxin-antitoxin system RelE/ParE family toxin [Cyclobacteriaceae bacterium]